MKLPSSRDAIKLYAVIGVLAATALWISYYLLFTGSGYRVGKPLDTPGWNAANELNTKFMNEKQFADVAASVVSESPLKFKIEGALHPPTTLDELKSFVEQHKGAAEVEIDVIMLDH